MSRKKSFQLNGTTYVLNTVPRSQLTEVWNLQRRLLELAAPYDLCVGTVLTDLEALEVIKELLELIKFQTPKGESVNLSIEDFEDYSVLGDLFLGEKNTGNKDEPLKESWLSYVNRFSFLATMKKLIMSLELEQMKTLMENPGIQAMNNF